MVKKAASIIDRSVDRLGYWIGGYTILSGFYAWLLNQLPILAELNWAAFVLLGIGLSLVSAFLISASLAMVRFFKPLPNSTGLIEASDEYRKQGELEHQASNALVLEKYEDKFRDEIESIKVHLGNVEQSTISHNRLLALEEALKIAEPKTKQVSDAKSKITDRMAVFVNDPLLAEDSYANEVQLLLDSVIEAPTEFAKDFGDILNFKYDSVGTPRMDNNPHSVTAPFQAEMPSDRSRYEYQKKWERFERAEKFWKPIPRKINQMIFSERRKLLDLKS